MSVCCGFFPSGWEKMEVTFKRSSNAQEKRVEIIHLKSRLRYQNEPLGVTAVKCFCLFGIGVPLFSFFQLCLQSVRTFLVPIQERSSSLFYREICHLIKLPLYLIGMQFAALLGIFSPLEGRAFFAKMERLVHQNKGRREGGAACLESFSSFCGGIREKICSSHPKITLFIGYCMQPIGSLQDPHIENVRPIQAERGA